MWFCSCKLEFYRERLQILSEDKMYEVHQNKKDDDNYKPGQINYACSCVKIFIGQRQTDCGCTRMLPSPPRWATPSTSGSWSSSTVAAIRIPTNQVGDDTDAPENRPIRWGVGKLSKTWGGFAICGTYLLTAHLRLIKKMNLTKVTWNVRWQHPSIIITIISCRVT